MFARRAANRWRCNQSHSWPTLLNGAANDCTQDYQQIALRLLELLTQQKYSCTKGYQQIGLQLVTLLIDGAAFEFQKGDLETVMNVVLDVFKVVPSK